MTIEPRPLPDKALLRAYEQPGGYTDCFATEVPAAVTHEQYVAAFYTTPLFKCERFILRWAIAQPSTDAEARELASGLRDAFAAWTVEQRCANQLLLADIYGSTRSWLMVEPVVTGTRLYFGSAVVRKPAGGRRSGFCWASTKPIPVRCSRRLDEHWPAEPEFLQVPEERRHAGDEVAGVLAVHAWEMPVAGKGLRRPARTWVPCLAQSVTPAL